MKIRRLFEIVYYLMNSRGVTARELAEKFEVSIRTIYRDIDILSYSGIPVYTTQGMGGGIFLDKTYVLNKSLLTQEEQQNILSALQVLAATDETKSKNLLARLSNFFQNTTESWIDVDISEWGMDHGKETLNTIRKAILQNSTLSFSYSNSAGVTSCRIVYPYKVVFKSRSWYVLGFCKKQQNYRFFKLNRMREVRIKSEFFNKETLPPAPDWKRLEQDVPSLMRVVLRFSAQLAYRVYDEFSYAQIVKNPDESFLVTAELPEGDWLSGYILSFGEHVEVLEPETLRKTVLQNVKNIQKKYLKQT